MRRRKAIVQVKNAARDLLLRHMPEDQADSLADKMSTGTWTHDYPISAEEAARFGLTVSTDIPKEVIELMTLYPQPMRQQAGNRGVEYLPAHRRKDRSGAGAQIE